MIPYTRCSIMRQQCRTNGGSWRSGPRSGGVGGSVRSGGGGGGGGEKRVVACVRGGLFVQIDTIMCLLSSNYTYFFFYRSKAGTR